MTKRVELAKILTATNRLDEAESQIETALQQTPDEPETVFVAARIAELTGAPARSGGTLPSLSGAGAFQAS